MYFIVVLVIYSCSRQTSFLCSLCDIIISAAFGSQLGLMLGASVLTIFELFDYIITFITATYVKRKSKQTSNAEDDQRTSSQ